MTGWLTGELTGLLTEILLCREKGLRLIAAFMTSDL